MSPHGIARPPDRSSRNSGNKCQLAKPLILPNFIAPLQLVYEKIVKIFTPVTILAPQGDPLGQSSPIWVMTYSKLPNFVPF